MLKTFYKMTNDNVFYFYIWKNEENLWVSTSKGMGEFSEYTYLETCPQKTATEKAEERITEMEREGYREVFLYDCDILNVEYVVNGFGTDKDLEKRHALQDFLEEVLMTRGLGLCDGGSIGSGTMEVFCYVFDYEKTLPIITHALKETEFENYSRIFQEENDFDDENEDNL